MKRQQQFPQPAPPLVAAPSAITTHFVYLVACADQTLYTGYTTNVERRLAAHNAGKGARYTRGRPVTLLATWQFASKGEALRAERAIKSLSRQQKCQLVLEGGQASLGLTSEFQVSTISHGHLQGVGHTQARRRLGNSAGSADAQSDWLRSAEADPAGPSPGENQPSHCDVGELAGGRRRSGTAARAGASDLMQAFDLEQVLQVLQAVSNCLGHHPN